MTVEHELVVVADYLDMDEESAGHSVPFVWGIDEAGTLMNHFITIANIESSQPEVIRQGNERVIRPRLADAKFFWDKDGQKRLADHAEVREFLRATLELDLDVVIYTARIDRGMSPPDVLAEIVTNEIDVPTIGIGAGVNCDGQVLVLHDLLGLGGGELLGQRLGEKIGVDEVSIASEPGASTSQASLLVGKYLTPELLVSYGIGLFEPVSTLRLRYTLSSRWKLVGEASAERSSTSPRLLWTTPASRRMRPGATTITTVISICSSRATRTGVRISSVA